MSFHQFYVSRMGRPIQAFRSLASRVNLSGLPGMGRFSNATMASEFIDIVITEVIAFALFGVLIASIAAANLTGALKGQNGLLTGLVTLFYILSAALLPLGIVRRATGKGR